MAAYWKKIGISFFGILTSLWLLSLTSAFAGNDAHAPRWYSPEELRQRGRPLESKPILEIQFKYDADAQEPLKIHRLTVKQGHAPQYEPVESGYVLSLHSATGDELFALTFRIPNRIVDPPPQAGETPEAPPVLRSMGFALTVPMVEGAVELRVKDPGGNQIIQKSLRGIAVEQNRPAFHSRPGHETSWMPQERRNPSRLARLIRSWFDASTAEAATETDGALDIVFVGDRYTDADLTRYQNDVDRAISHMLTYEPFASRADQISFHRVDNTTVDLGSHRDASVQRLLLCDNDAVISVVNSAGAPYDKIIVLVNDPDYGGSSSMGGPIAVSYNGPDEPQVVVHEFGHSLGSLLDEYNLSSTNGALDGTTHSNCYAGPPPDSDWAGLVNSSGYTLGCNYPNWYRSSPSSIMLELSSHYFNVVSQRQLSAKIDFYTYTGPPPPQLTFSATSSSVKPGNSVTLSWWTAHATACTASGGWSGSKPLSGEETVVVTDTTTYTLTVSSDLGSTERSITVEVDRGAPQVSLISPVDGSTTSGQIMMKATATDDVRVGWVAFCVDGSVKATDTSYPYASSWWNTGVLANGPHAFQAKAFDDLSNEGSSAVATVTVANPLSITAPADGATVSGTVGVAASVSGDAKASRVSFYVDNVLKATDTSAPYSFSWVTRSVPDGPHTLQAKALDINTRTLGTTAPVQVNLENVRIASPSAGATVSGIVAVSASVASHYGTNRVRFYVNGALKSTDATSPYAFSWDTRTLANGSYTLQVKTYKYNSTTHTTLLTGTSVPVSVTVSN